MSESNQSPTGSSAHARPYPHDRSVAVVIEANTDDLVARKVGTNPSAIVAIAREALVLSQLRHPNIVELVRTESAVGTSTLVTHFAGRTTLAQFQPVDAVAVARVGAALLTTVSEIHELGWVHARLTEEHCIVGANGRLTLCALGGAHRAQPGDPRILEDTADALAIVAEVASRLATPRGRAARTAHRRLADILCTGAADRTTEGAEQVRLQLSRLGGSGSPTAAADTSPTATRPRPPAVSRGEDVTTTSRPPSSRARRRLAVSRRQQATPSALNPIPSRSRWRSTTAAAGALTGLVATIALLRWLGGPLANPFDAPAVTRLGDIAQPVAVALALVRFVALAAALYGVALATATLAAIVSRRHDLERLATSMAPPMLRRAIIGLIGLGLLSSAATTPTSGPTPPAAAEAAAAPAAAPALAPTGAETPTAPTTVAPPTPPQPAGPTTPPPAPTIDAAPVPAAALPSMWVIEPGDHLWGVAASTIARHLGRQPRPSEVDDYWLEVIALNEGSLIDPANPDLVFAGQVIELPPLS